LFSEIDRKELDNRAGLAHEAQKGERAILDNRMVTVNID